MCHLIWDNWSNLIDHSDDRYHSIGREVERASRNSRTSILICHFLIRQDREVTYRVDWGFWKNATPCSESYKTFVGITNAHKSKRHRNQFPSLLSFSSQWPHEQCKWIRLSAQKMGNKWTFPSSVSSLIIERLTYAHEMLHWWFRVQTKGVSDIRAAERFVSDMPYLLISTRIRLESGPTIVGDDRADPEVMAHLDAQLYHEKCNT